MADKLDGGMPSDALLYAADEAIAHGKPVVLESYGIVVVPDMTALKAIAQGKELLDTQRFHTKDGREVMIYTWPGLEAVDME